MVVEAKKKDKPDSGMDSGSFNNTLSGGDNEQPPPPIVDSGEITLEPINTTMQPSVSPTNSHNPSSPLTQGNIGDEDDKVCFPEDMDFVVSVQSCILDNVKKNGGIAPQASDCLCNLPNFCLSLVQCNEPLFDLVYFDQQCRYKSNPKTPGVLTPINDIVDSQPFCRVSFKVLGSTCCENQDEYEKKPSIVPVTVPTRSPIKDNDDHSATFKPTKTAKPKTQSPASTPVESPVASPTLPNSPTSPTAPTTKIVTEKTKAPTAASLDGSSGNTPKVDDGDKQLFPLIIVGTAIGSFVFGAILFALVYRYRNRKNKPATASSQDSSDSTPQRPRRDRRRRNDGRLRTFRSNPSVVTAEVVSDHRSDRGSSLRESSVDDVTHHRGNRRGNRHDDDEDDDDGYPPASELILISGICEGAEDQVVAEVEEEHKERLLKTYGTRHSINQEIALASSPAASLAAIVFRENRSRSAPIKLPSAPLLSVGDNHGVSCENLSSRLIREDQNSAIASAPTLEPIPEQSVEVVPTESTSSSLSNVPEEAQRETNNASAVAPPLPPPIQTEEEKPVAPQKHKGLVALFVIAEELASLYAEAAPAIDLLLRRVSMMTSARDLLIALQQICGVDEVASVANRIKAQGWTPEQMAKAQKRLKDKYIVAKTIQDREREQQQQAESIAPTPQHTAIVIAAPSPSSESTENSEVAIRDLPMAPSHPLAATRARSVENEESEEEVHEPRQLVLV